MPGTRPTWRPGRTSLPRGAREGLRGRLRGARHRADRRGGRRRSAARSGTGRRSRTRAAALAALAERYRLGGDHELRRRPVRGVEPAARRDVRLDRHGPAGRRVQAEPPRTSSSPSSGSTVPRDRILHVAQSLFHDHVPAKRLGLRTAWINRRGDRPGSGATPPATPRRTRRSRTWPPSPRTHSEADSPGAQAHGFPNQSDNVARVAPCSRPLPRRRGRGCVRRRPSRARNQLRAPCGRDRRAPWGPARPADQGGRRIRPTVVRIVRKRFAQRRWAGRARRPGVRFPH